MSTRTSDTIIVPADYNVRLSLRPPEAVVVITPPQVTPTPEGVMAVPSLSTMVTHDAGLNWPDATGTAIAREMLAAGGCVLLVFATLADGLACHARLLRERAS